MFAGLNAWLVIVYLVNVALGSNYLFVNRKPDTASLIDVLPAWPWYVLVLEAICLVVFVICYLPFAIKDYRERRRARQS